MTYISVNTYLGYYLKFTKHIQRRSFIKMFATTTSYKNIISTRCLPVVMTSQCVFVSGGRSIQCVRRGGHVHTHGHNTDGRHVASRRRPGVDWVALAAGPATSPSHSLSASTLSLTTFVPVTFISRVNKYSCAIIGHLSQCSVLPFCLVNVESIYSHTLKVFQDNFLRITN